MLQHPYYSIHYNLVYGVADPVVQHGDHRPADKHHNGEHSDGRVEQIPGGSKQACHCKQCYTNGTQFI